MDDPARLDGLGGGLTEAGGVDSVNGLRRAAMAGTFRSPLPYRAMDPGLHVKQAVNHLNKVLAYYPYVASDGEAVVALTPEDWGVVADAFFHMGTPKEVFPDAIESYEMSGDGSEIELTVADGTLVRVQAG